MLKQQRTHPECVKLRNVEWLVFGTIGFRHPHKTYQSTIHKFVDGIWRKIFINNHWIRRQKVSGLMLGLARNLRVKSKHLLHFQSYERNADNYYHCHLLVGKKNITWKAKDVCSMLYRMARKYGFGDCQFLPYDASKDGIGYVTKRQCFSNEEELPVFHFSNALLKEVAHEQ